MADGKTITNHALDADAATLAQFKHCCDQDFVVKASLMPDAHSGYVAPIGAVLVTKGQVVPSWVGYDIGCGMIAMQLKGKGLVGKVRANAQRIYNLVKATVPMGMGDTSKIDELTPGTRREFAQLLEKFAEGPHDKQILAGLKSSAKHLGTLGSGNHFIELDHYKGRELWLIIHSGSRGVGYKVAEKYMQKSAGKTEGFEETHPLAVDSELGKEYLNILEFGLAFALLNRLEMSYKVVEALRKVLGEPIEAELWANKNHNHAILEDGHYIHRKGATPAKRWERGVIPANMRDGTFLIEGHGNPEFLESSSHGAGRALSRTQARKQFTIDEFRKSMDGITGTVEEGTLDEIPMAYKDIFKVMEAQKESVTVLKQVIPIINWKGGYDHPKRERKTKEQKETKTTKAPEAPNDANEAKPADG